MAEQHFTSAHPVAELITQNRFAQSPAAIGLDLSSEIIVHTPYTYITEYQGTRAALEAEGVIPSGTKWPKDFDYQRWQDDKFFYSLRRLRPEGVKGPRKQFLDIDWWMFRWEPLSVKPANVRELERKTKELTDFIHRNSAEGAAENMKQYECYLEAQKDEKFQAFKASIPGMIRLKHERRTKSAKQSQPD